MKSLPLPSGQISIMLSAPVVPLYLGTQQQMAIALAILAALAVFLFKGKYERELLNVPFIRRYVSVIYPFAAAVLIIGLASQRAFFILFFPLIILMFAWQAQCLARIRTINKSLPGILLVPAPTYDWQCPVCEATNIKGSALCASCGSSVGLDGEEIEHRKKELASKELAEQK